MTTSEEMFIREDSIPIHRATLSETATTLNMTEDETQWWHDCACGSIARGIRKSKELGQSLADFGFALVTKMEAQGGYGFPLPDGYDDTEEDEKK